MFARLLARTALLLLACAAPAPAQSSQPANATVTGRVTIAGKAAPKVVVMLLPAGWGEDAKGLPRTATDAEGIYRLEAPVSGQFVVSAFAPGYAGPSDNRFGQPGKTVTLVAGDTVEGVDLELARGGVITGRVTYRDGRPVVDARMNLFLLDAAGKPQQIHGTMWRSQTDDRGVYRLYGLAAGRYLVAVGESNNTISIGQRVLPLTYYPDAAEREGAVAVAVEPGGEARSIDIVARRRERGYTVAGRVVDAETGQPVPDLPVLNAFYFDGGGTGYTDLGARSGPQGEFRFDGVKPGRYGLVLRPASEDAVSWYAKPEPYTVSDRDVTGLEVRVHKGAVVSGTVVVEGTSDPAILARLAEVNIGLRRDDPSADNEMGVGARVKPDGTFRANGVPSGRVRFTFWAGRVKGFNLARVERDGVDLGGLSLDVAEGEHVSDIRVVVAYGTGAIRGEVKVEGGEPAGSTKGIILELVRQGRSSPQWIRIDDRGRFLVEGLAPGEYELKVVDARKGWEQRTVVTTRTVTVAGDTPAHVTIAVDLTREPGGEQ